MTPQHICTLPHPRTRRPMVKYMMYKSLRKVPQPSALDHRLRMADTGSGTTSVSGRGGEEQRGVPESAIGGTGGSKASSLTRQYLDRWSTVGG